MPAYDLLLLDRMLVIAQKAAIQPLICFNKIDLLDDNISQYQRSKMHIRSAGFSVFAVSATQNTGMDELRAALSHGTTVMAGQSGVGKSSLLNRLLPEENAEVGDVSERSAAAAIRPLYSNTPVAGSNDGFIADTQVFLLLNCRQILLQRN